MQRMTGIRRITCVCGKVIEGKDDDELWVKAQAHVAADHPDLVGKVSREDILARAEETLDGRRWSRRAGVGRRPARLGWARFRARRGA